MLIEIVMATGFVAASVLGVLLVRKFVPLEELMEHHEVAGICFAVLGGLYGIILAFVLVSSWERYETARAETEQEASAAADIYRHAEGFSEPARSRIGNAVVAYMRSVIDDEWPGMATGSLSTATQSRFFEVWASIIEQHPESDWEVALYQSTLDRLDDFADGRQHRGFYLQSGLPGVIWTFMIVFGAATVCFTYLFGMRRLLTQVLITAVLAATIAWMLLLVRETQSPFSGSLRVSDRAFRVALGFMRPQAVSTADQQP